MLPHQLSVDAEDRTRPGLRVAMPVEPAAAIIVAGALVSAPLIAFSLANTAGLAMLWDNLHWSLASAAAFIATLVGARSATGRAGAIRGAGAIAFGLWLVANLMWNGMAYLGSQSIPSLADLVVIAVALPMVYILVKGVQGRLTHAEEIAVYFDGALLLILVGTTILVGHGETALMLPSFAGAIGLAYPTVLIGLSAATLLSYIVIRLRPTPSGGFALVAGTAILGVAYLLWVVPTVTDGAAGAGLPGVLFTIGTLIGGFGVATWRDDTVETPRAIEKSRFRARVIGPAAAAFTFLALLVPQPAPLSHIVHVAVFVTGTLVITRQGLLLRERTNMLAEVRALHDENDRLVDDLRAELLERERVQNRLVNTSRLAAVGELAAGVAHEVNNPLTSVLGFSEILIEDFEPDDPRRQDLETIRDAALRARSIVRALRDFARPQDPQLVPTDLSELVTRMTDLVRFPMTKAGVTIVETHAEMPRILLDPQAIQQAVLNVLTNAMQAMPNGGSLRVSTTVRDANAVVTIADDGSGMDDVVAAQAFVPFFSTRQATGSSGLGLAVSLGLVESHHGSIRLETSEGAGTTVEIALPMVAQADAGPDAQERTA